jgi:hypothetical protein
MKFSQRLGITPIEKALQIEAMDDDLRNSLWSLLKTFYFDKFNRSKYDMYRGRYDYISSSNLNSLFRSLWFSFFKKPIDTIPSLYYDSDGGYGQLREYFFKTTWHGVYDFVEFISQNGAEYIRDEFITACNNVLDRENSGYRFVDGKIIEISSPDEIAEIEEAIKKSTPYYGVKQHLSNAITLLGDKEKPDYRNSIKESISAVEALCKALSNDEKGTLGDALKTLEKERKIHPALKSAFSSLYGYTNDSDGIRHALMEESKLTSADARFMLISCSAFVNYLIDKLNQ